MAWNSSSVSTPLSSSFLSFEISSRGSFTTAPATTTSAPSGACRNPVEESRSHLLRLGLPDLDAELFDERGDDLRLIRHDIHDVQALQVRKVLRARVAIDRAALVHGGARVGARRQEDLHTTDAAAEAVGPWATAAFMVDHVPDGDVQHVAEDLGAARQTRIVELRGVLVELARVAVDGKRVRYTRLSVKMNSSRFSFARRPETHIEFPTPTRGTHPMSTLGMAPIMTITVVSGPRGGMQKHAAGWRNAFVISHSGLRSTARMVSSGLMSLPCFDVGVGGVPEELWRARLERGHAATLR